LIAIETLPRHQAGDQVDDAQIEPVAQTVALPAHAERSAPASVS
jgi:hypothetical protein